jgi:hypothetical protein
MTRNWRRQDRIKLSYGEFSAGAASVHLSPSEAELGWRAVANRAAHRLFESIA